jgi:hypothetical protein
MIIGLVGFSKTGKDAIGKILEDELKFQPIAFADALKRTCMDLFDFDYAQLWGSLKEVPDERYPREHDWATHPHYGVVACRCCRRGIQVESHSGCFLTPRYAMQIIGTEGVRQCYPNYWMEKALQDAHSIEKGLRYSRTHGVIGVAEDHVGVHTAVFTDGRFLNEVDGILKMGGRIYRVKRPGHELAPHQHTSETEQLQIPDDRLQGVINNDGTLEDLRRTVLGLFG